MTQFDDNSKQSCLTWSYVGSRNAKLRTPIARLGPVGVDGTKIKANASKHKAMSYARMQEEEARLGCLSIRTRHSCQKRVQ
jgi:hypothetical protein